MLLCEYFVKFVFLTSQKCSRENFSKVITFFALQFVFIAFGSFLLIWPLSIKQLVTQAAQTHVTRRGGKVIYLP